MSELILRLKDKVKVLLPEFLSQANKVMLSYSFVFLRDNRTPAQGIKDLCHPRAIDCRSRARMPEGRLKSLSPRDRV